MSTHYTQHVPTDQMTTAEPTAPQLVLDPEFRETWQSQLNAYAAELETKEAERLELTAIIRELRRRINALRSLLGQEPLQPIESQLGSPTETPHATKSDDRTEAVLNLAIEILEEKQHEEPEGTHYEVLANEVQRRGGNLPQKSRNDMLIRMMNDDPQRRFIRPRRRGYYALTANVAPGTKNVGERKPS